MEILNKWCRTCGGDLIKLNDQLYQCQNCKNQYSNEETKKHIETMRSLLDETKLEALSNARRNLYDAVNAEYVSSTQVHECCVILKQLLPDDFQANFYETVNGGNSRKIAKYLRKVDAVEHADCMDSAIGFLINSLQSDYVLETSDLIDRAYKASDLVKYEQYSTRLSEEAQKLDNCIYMTAYPRDVFVAYSSKDMDKVFDLVECLEEQGLSCFVAARNLRHGRGAVENYERALHEAMDNCTSFVFVSSTNSRHARCDALSKEIPYIKGVDMATAPPEYRNDYGRMPHKYKKHRVEYRIQESVRPMAADRVVSDFFDGYERVYSPDEVADRVLHAGMEYEEIVAEPTPPPNVSPVNETAEDRKIKFCVGCKAECPEKANFCLNCGGKEFANSLREIELLQQIAALQQPKKVKYCIYCANECSENDAKCLLCGGDKFVDSLDKLNVQGSNEKKQEQYTEESRNVPDMKQKLASEGLTFEKKDDGTYEVSGIGTYSKKELVIPSVYKGVAVTSIGSGAFDGCIDLISVTMPDSLVNIGEEAFNACTGLTTVTLPKSVNCIGAAAFSECTALKSVVIPDAVTSIEVATFGHCSSLSSVIIGDGVDYIDDFAFQECTSLKSITIPDSVSNIGNLVFYNCCGLTSVTIGAGVRSIGDFVFQKCNNLTSIKIPRSLNNIGRSAFLDCQNLKEIDYSGSKFEWDAIAKGNGWDDKTGNYTIHYAVKSETHISEKTIVCKNKREVKNPSRLISVRVPEGTLDLEAEAFRECENLKRIFIPNSMVKIDDPFHIFFGCYNLEEICVEEGNRVYCSIDGCLYDKKMTTLLFCPFAKKEVIIPTSVSSIKSWGGSDLINSHVVPGNQSYSSLDGVIYDKKLTCLISCPRGKKEIDIPNSVVRIGKSALFYCDKLSQITLPSSIKAIGENAFAGCDNLKKVFFENPNNWKKGLGLFDSIPAATLSDPEKAAQAITKTYTNKELKRTK